MELKNVFSKLGRVEDHPEILKIYCYDFLHIPKPFSSFVKKPIIVVQPEKGEDLVEILEICERLRIPIVPRGSATSAYGGCVTLKECVVVDFKKMSSFEFQEDKVVAESGAIWMEIEKKAVKVGKTLCVYPTNATVSTVGGWIAQNGFGIGSLKYGSIGENVEWLEVVDFDGIKIVKGEKMKYYIGACGTTGLILRACVRLRENLEISSRTISCRFEDAIHEIEDGYHADFKDSRYLKAEGYDLGDTLLFCSENGESNEIGREMWKKRLNPLRVVSKGKKIFSEVIVPYEVAKIFYEYATKFSDGVEAIFSKDCVIFLTIFGKKRINILKALKLIKIAEKLGGSVYGKGVLFSHKYNREIMSYKQKIDPENLLNPGKMGWNVFSRAIRLVERFI
ncbi:MAG: FAD-binding oxidoreductase [Archaeoglobaceae archaeon]|nr:FAD-binding oxidoreductase [Archaeoglobaceae archaeon]